MSAILKQNAIDIANAFEKYGLWKGGGSGGSVSAKIDMLWENPSPSTSFSEQNVTIDTNYDIFIIDFIPNNNSTIHFTMLLNKVFNRKYALYCNNGGSQDQQYQRAFTFQDGYVNFEIGKRPGITFDNSLCIPMVVYGIKFESYLHEYSTEEKVVGKWIDGRNVYESVINAENITLQPYVWTNIYMIENMEKIIDITCIVGTVLNDGRLRWNCLNNFICGASEENNFYISNCTIIVQYIKTE